METTVSPEMNDYITRMREETAKVLKAINNMIVLTNNMSNTDLSLPDLIRLYYEANSKNDVIEDCRKRFNDLPLKFGKTTIPERFAMDGVKTIKLEDVGRVTVSYRKSASMVDKEGGMGWIKKNEPDLITETVNAQTLAAYLFSEFIEKNVEPPEVFKFSTSPYTSITRG